MKQFKHYIIISIMFINKRNENKRNENKRNENKRNGYKWSINECLQLQREYELLELSIDEISIKHNRTPNAIMYKLDQEGFANYNTLYLQRLNEMANSKIINEEILTAIFA